MAQRIKGANQLPPLRIKLIADLENTAKAVFVDLSAFLKKLKSAHAKSSPCEAHPQPTKRTPPKSPKRTAKCAAAHSSIEGSLIAWACGYRWCWATNRQAVANERRDLCLHLRSRDNRVASARSVSLSELRKDRRIRNTGRGCAKSTSIAKETRNLTA